MQTPAYDATDRFGNLYSKARTTKDITGSRIDTIKAGTEFLVQTHAKQERGGYVESSTPGYRNCIGLGVSSIWNDEFELLPRVSI